MADSELSAGSQANPPSPILEGDLLIEVPPFLKPACRPALPAATLVVHVCPSVCFVRWHASTGAARRRDSSKSDAQSRPSEVRISLQANVRYKHERHWAPRLPSHAVLRQPVTLNCSTMQVLKPGSASKLACYCWLHTAALDDSLVFELAGSQLDKARPPAPLQSTALF